MATPSLAMIPSAYADSKVYSVLPNNGDGDFTFDRASTATRVDQNGLIQTVAIDLPRLNYDINNGAVQSCPSLLLEPASTNLFTYSEEFSQSVWAKNSVGSASAPVVTSNYTTSPDGTQNASRLQLEIGGSSSSDKSFLENTQTLDGSSSYTLTFYIKSNNGVNQNLIFLQNSVSGDAITATNQWVRIEQSVTSNTTNARGFGLMALGNIQQSVDVLIFAAQLEQLSYSTSYIPTLSGAVQTRAAETCNGAGNAALFNSTEGVIYAEISALANDGTSRVISLSDSSDTNRVHLFYNISSNTINLNYRVAGSSKAVMSYAVSDVSVMQKIAYRWQSGSFVLYVNGVSRATDTNTIMMPSGTMNQLAFNVGGGTSYFYGNTKDLRVYNEALTDSQLQTLTTL